MTNYIIPAAYKQTPAQGILADAIVAALAKVGITATRQDEYEKDYIAVYLPERHPELDIRTLELPSVEGKDPEMDRVWWDWHGLSKMTIIVGND